MQLARPLFVAIVLVALAVTPAAASHGWDDVAGLVVSTPSDHELDRANADRGAIVDEVDRGSAWDDAGLEPGDVITSIDGWTVDSARDVRRHLKWADVDERVDVEVVRDGRVITTSIVAPEVERRRNAIYLDRDTDIRIGDIDIDFDEEEFEREMEAFGERMAELGERIGRSVERAVESRDWDRWERDVERRVERNVTIHLDELDDLGDIVGESVAASLDALEGLEIAFDSGDFERDMEALGRDLERMMEGIADEIEVDGRRYRD